MGYWLSLSIILLMRKTIMKKVLIASLLSSLFAAPAFAMAPGPYIALDINSTSVTNTGPLGNPGTGFRIGAGYRITPNLGVEANYGETGSSNSVAGMSYKVSAFQLAAIGIYPVNDQIDVFARLGASANKVTPSGYSLPSTNKTDLLVGVGGQYHFNQNWGVRLMYESYGKATSGNPGGDSSVSAVSLGGVYAF